MDDSRQQIITQSRIDATIVINIFKFLWPNHKDIERFKLAAAITGISESGIKGNMQRPFLPNSSYISKNGFSKPLLKSMQMYEKLVRNGIETPITLDHLHKVKS